MSILKDRSKGELSKSCFLKRPKPEHINLPREFWCSRHRHNAVLRHPLEKDRLRVTMADRFFFEEIFAEPKKEMLSTDTVLHFRQANPKTNLPKAGVAPQSR